MITLYKFYGSKCSGCDQFDALRSQVKNYFIGKISLVSVNTDPDADEDDQNITIKFSRDLRSIPALILYVDDSVYFKYSGNMFHLDEIIGRVNNNLLHVL